MSRVLWGVLLGLCLVSATGCWSAGGRPIDWEQWHELPDWNDDAPRELEIRARGWEEWLKFHVTEEGRLLYRMPNNAWQNPHSDLADQACWTGYLLAARVFHYNVEPTDARREDVRLALLGVASLHDATGVEGFFARCLMPTDLVAERAHRPHEWFPSVVDPAWSYRGDTSKDQYSGLIFGLTAVTRCYDDPDAVAEAGRLLAACARHLLDGDYRLRDHRGEVPRFGGFQPRVFGVAIGVHSALLISLFRAAQPFVTPDERERLDVALQELRGSFHRLHFELFGIRNYSNVIMSAAALLSIGLLERDAPTTFRALWWRRVDDFLLEFEGEGNALLVSLGVLAGRRNVREEGIARRNLLSAPTSLLLVPIELDRYSTLARRWVPDRKGRPRALDPLPLAARPVSSFCWRTDPFRLDPKPLADGKLRHSGVDLYLAYWLGRYTGWLPSSQERPGT